MTKIDPNRFWWNEESRKITEAHMKHNDAVQEKIKQKNQEKVKENAHKKARAFLKKSNKISEGFQFKYAPWQYNEIFNK